MKINLEISFQSVFVCIILNAAMMVMWGYDSNTIMAFGISCILSYALFIILWYRTNRKKSNDDSHKDSEIRALETIIKYQDSVIKRQSANISELKNKQDS